LLDKAAAAPAAAAAAAAKPGSGSWYDKYHSKLASCRVALASSVLEGQGRSDWLFMLESDAR